jgi:anti-sigma factor (TIGR02949 family)
MDSNNEGGCKEFKKCMEILHLMLDNEATDHQEQYVKDHIEICMVCFEQYEVEKQIRDLIKTKIEQRPVPNDLIEDIRGKIQHFG